MRNVLYSNNLLFSTFFVMYLYKKTYFYSMKKIYHLKTCDTNRRILKQIKATLKDNFNGFIFQEIKTEPITVHQLEEMYHLTKSYELLFSKRAKRYKLLKDNNLTEKDFKQLLIEEYTFLKRPVIIIDDEIFIGNSKKNVDLLLQKSRRNCN